jgi:glycosyltransferase involved in cell wall biosynthesis
MKKRVCHISSVHNALDTRIFYRFCKTLSQYYEVSLIAVHPRAETISGIKIIPFQRFRNKILRVCFTWLIMFFKAIKVNAHVYQFHDPELIPCGLLLRLFGKKVIFDIHENVAEDIFDKPWIPNKKLLFAIFSYFEKKAVRRFKIFLAEKSYEKRYKSMNADYSVVLNYCDTRFFKPFSQSVNRQTNRIFYIGILLESRGIQQIAEAIYILKQKGVTVHFDVVGELYSSLQLQLRALPFWNEVSSQIHFHGRLPLEEGYEISRNAAAGMCIIQPMNNSVGSYPTKMFEYMSIGLPQIISNFPLYKSVVETHHCGLCVDPSSPIQIAHAIETIFNSNELAATMSQNGLQNAPQYDWNSQAEITLSEYRNILN